MVRTLESTTAELAGLLRGAERAIVLTGAGISVPSGIPDFRSPGTGIWEGVDPMEVAHIDAWRRDPDRFWSFYGSRFSGLVDKRPNRAHEVVAELERSGRVRAVITQNIDRLHRVAGSRRLLEIHGSIESSVCPQCGGRTAVEQVVALLAAGDGAPECPACIAPLKPDVVLFGELLPADVMAEAEQLALEADLMVCIGSSLTVHPAAGLPQLTLGSGGRIAIVTEGPTPLDDRAAVKLSGDVVAELEAVAEALRT
ncbi:MAG TPA: NAD-dependent deacylase [Thermoleophilaceae bacterium]|nr:NAD-dependent deacylase [Thermoleophilaceae bacterium]